MCVVLVTCPTGRSAARIASALVRHRLAACVNVIGGVESIFRWRRKIERSREVLLLIKTRRSAVKRLERTIVPLHPYEVPEIVALPIVAGQQAYLDWLSASTR